MANEGPKTGFADPNTACPARRLPAELLLDIWGMVPPLERVCASQVCSAWRRVSLASPWLWTQVIFLSAPWDPWTSRLWPNAAERSRWQQEAVCNGFDGFSKSKNAHFRNVFNPSPGTNNLALFDELLPRSGQLPLDITVFPPDDHKDVKRLLSVLGKHAQRISRLHFRYCFFPDIEVLLRESGGSLPALRTLTAGFDNHIFVHEDKPPRITDSEQFPALRQVHLGAEAATWTLDWNSLGLDGIDYLTIVPHDDHNIIHALSVCPNLSSLTLVMSALSSRYLIITEAVLAALARVQSITVRGMHHKADDFVFALFDTARFSDLTFDCRGRAPWLDWVLPSPCRVLEQPVRLTVQLTDASYDVEVVDSAQRRRRILLDVGTVSKCPSLWGFWLREQEVSAATVDARAWNYFTGGIPASTSIPELTIAVRADPGELDTISLSKVSGLQQLHIDVLASGLHFPRGAVSNLVRDAQLRVLSLAADAAFDDAEELSALAERLEFR
ncbi:hypothetical protein AURDEDRAFT_188196 [Auricularia subglabra TFB-10046 SS5]|uniref:F-box domain-containing protein n=1 Tax=Auricularia subglabra (strain TFB-10046 / SS5) TaxID=717982 RepID=J0WVA1_AURST|nr:hypothetical protein AURDEDRAFT_188196 [Auricularia subglabra TFB-10046 SS5]